jgi:hypothetical protein
MNDGKSNALMNGDDMTGIDKRTPLAARIKGMAGLLACWLAMFSPGLVLGQTGPVLPPQAVRVMNQLTTLVVTNTAVETTPPGQQVPTALVTKHFTFFYPNREALLADGWSFMASRSGTNRNTEITDPVQGLVVDYDQSAHPGSIIVPTDLGDFFQIDNNRVYPSRNFLSRALSPNWVEINLTMTFAPGADTQQAGMALYQDDDNFALLTIGHASNWRASHVFPDGSIDCVGGGCNPTDREVWALEYGGTLPQSVFGPVYCPHVHLAPLGAPTHVLRLDRDTTNNCVQAWWTLNDNFKDVGSPGQLTGYEQPPQLVNPRLAIWTGCDPPATPGAATMVLSELEITSLEPALALLSYSFLSAPVGASIDANGIITWTPAKGQFPSTNVFTTVVTDNSVPPNSATNSFTVVLQDINSAPTLLPQPDRTMSVLDTLTVNNTAIDDAVTVNQNATNTVLFNYANRSALLADGWSFIGTSPDGSARNTETTAGAGVVDYNQAAHPGLLNIPCDLGDLYDTGPSANNTRNSLFRSLPAGWQSVRLALTFGPVTANYQQAHVGLYQDDDNYLQVGVAFNSYDGNARLTMDREIGGVGTTPARASASGTSFNFRLDRNLMDSTVTAYYSYDGVIWTSLGTMSLTLTNPRLMIWTGGSQVPYASGSGLPVLGLQRLDILVGTRAPLVLSYSLSNPPPGAAIDSHGIITWQSATNGLGTYVFTTVVTDNGEPPSSATNSFNVRVLPPPWPVLPNQPARTVNQFTTLVVTNTAIDGALTINQLATNTMLFNYASRSALLGDGWSFIGTNPDGSARNTETAAGAGMVDYNQAGHPGFLNIPCDIGDLYDIGPSVNNTRNSLFRSLPADWQSVRLALTFAPVTADYQQAHLGLYQDDDDYVQMGVAYNHWDSTGNPRFTVDSEIGGVPATPAKTPTTSTLLDFRLDRNPSDSTVTAYYSVDGATWTVLGTTALTLANPRLVIWTGGAQTAYAGSGAIMSLQRLDMVGGAPVPTVLSYALVNPPTGATIDNNGIITWQPSGTNAPGTAVFTTVATDNGLPPLRATNSFTVTVVGSPAPPTIKSVIMSTGAVVITWDCAIGSTYRVQYKDNLAQTTWLDLLPDMTAAGHTMTSTNAIGSSPARFFRVLLLH